MPNYGSLCTLFYVLYGQTEVIVYIFRSVQLDRCQIVHHFHSNRRRIFKAEKARVVAAVWGTELIKASLAILHQDDMNKRSNSSYSSNRPCAK